jgi:hypothetical protein
VSSFVRRAALPALAAVAAVATLAGSPPAAARAQEAPGPEGGAVLGTVWSTPPPNRVPLEGAWVEVLDAGGELVATTDSSGAYRLSPVPAGIRRIRVHRLGSVPLELQVRIPPGDTVRLDVELEWSPLPLQEIAVRSRAAPPPVDTAEVSTGDLAELGVRALDAAPGFAEAGVAAAARELAGERGRDPARALLMRGSAADQKLVLLDGAPVYAPFHLGGLLRTFETSLLSEARHYVGAPPARYHGGLSYVLDLGTRSGSREGWRGSGTLDLIGAGLRAEGPLGDDASVLASGRTLHDVLSPLGGGGTSPYGYGEALLRVDLRPDSTHRFGATGFWNREEVRLRLPAPGTVGEAEPASRLERPTAAEWGNAAASLRYRGRWEATRLDVTLAGSRYRAIMPLAFDRPAVGEARTDRLRTVAELVHETGPWTLRAGASAEGIDHRGSASALVQDSVLESSREEGTGSLGIHAGASRPLGDGLHLRGGLRADYFSDGGGLRLAPRGSLSWSLTDRADLTLAAGRFFQLPRGGELEVRMALDDPAGVGTGHQVHGPAEASHLVLSLDQRLSSELDLGLDGFYKGFRGLPGYGDDVLRSSGLDLRISGEGDDLAGWLGYTLAWFWEPDDAAGVDRSSEFAGRHLINAGLRGRILPGLGGELTVSYGDGLPYTSLPVIGRAQEEGGAVRFPVVDRELGEAVGTQEGEDRISTLDGFLRVDLEIYGDWRIGSGGATGEGARISPYLRLLNAVARRDALFYYFEPWRSDELQALAERPVLPVVGVEVTF